MQILLACGLSFQEVFRHPGKLYLCKFLSSSLLVLALLSYLLNVFLFSILFTPSCSSWTDVSYSGSGWGVSHCDLRFNPLSSSRTKRMIYSVHFNCRSSWI